jgi:hypothetical protein
VEAGVQVWEYLEVLVEGPAWLDSSGRYGELPLVGAAPPAAEAKTDRWGRALPQEAPPQGSGSRVGVGRRWESLGPLLNQLGREGWELLTLVVVSQELRLSSAEYRLLFKRPA